MLLAAGLFCALGCLVGGLFINVAMGFPMEIGRVLRTPIPTDRWGTTSLWSEVSFLHAFWICGPVPEAGSENRVPKPSAGLP